MRKACMLCVAVALALSIASCQDYICIFPEDSLSGVKGRLWFNPNPIRFPLKESGSGEISVQVNLANIGSEIVQIEAINFSADSDFRLDLGVLDLIDPVTGDLEFPIGFSADEGCERFSRLEVPVYYTPKTGDKAKGSFVIETNDPTSPTLEVPIMVDPDAVLPENQSYPVGVFPIVKPNPIRFHKSMDVGETQTLEVCLRLEGAAQSSQITSLEIHGENFSIQGVYDNVGNSIPLPVSEYNIGQYNLKILVANEPVNDKREGGTLLVEFVDDLGDHRTLLVPVLDDQ